LKPLLNQAPFIIKTLLVSIILTCFVYLITSTKEVALTEASEPISLSQSTTEISIFAKEVTKKPFEPVRPRDPRAVKLERFLKIQQSELAENADLIISLSDSYGIDYKVPVAISGSESGYCNKTYYDNNCWGYGRFEWPTLEAGIRGYLSKMNVGYFKNGQKTIEELAPIYNSANTEEFIAKVRHHYDLIP
jgi:hypothetical protein